MNLVCDLVSAIPATLDSFLPKPKRCPSEPVSRTIVHNYAQPMGPIIRIAGLSGAIAVGFGAYGAHALRNQDIDERRKVAFETASRYHLLHSVALLGSTHARFPMVTAGLFVAGIALFSGTIYHYSLTGREDYRFITPKGGICFILAWLSFLL
uniref:Transmembrane protein 256 homolog n=1 Tax=Steinernema glaseri TaxID=37863 RepID=A0A1I7YNV2_9BILA